ncbi:hypothetical protein D3C78_1535430 [compost metagenome]
MKALAVRAWPWAISTFSIMSWIDSTEGIVSGASAATARTTDSASERASVSSLPCTAMAAFRIAWTILS